MLPQFDRRDCPLIERQSRRLRARQEVNRARTSITSSGRAAMVTGKKALPETLRLLPLDQTIKPKQLPHRVNLLAARRQANRVGRLDRGATHFASAFGHEP
jgi:hypothetical protein